MRYRPRAGRWAAHINVSEGNLHLIKSLRFLFPPALCASSSPPHSLFWIKNLRYHLTITTMQAYMTVYLPLRWIVPRPCKFRADLKVINYCLADIVGISKSDAATLKVKYTVFDQLKLRLLRGKNARLNGMVAKVVALSAFSAFMLGAISKTVATVITYPTIRSRCKTMIQAADDEEEFEDKSKHPKTFLQALKANWSKEGIPVSSRAYKPDFENSASLFLSSNSNLIPLRISLFLSNNILAEMSCFFILSFLPSFSSFLHLFVGF